MDDMAALAFLLLHHSNILAITVSWILKIFSRYENDFGGNHFNRAMRGKGTLDIEMVTNLASDVRYESSQVVRIVGWGVLQYP